LVQGVVALMGDAAFVARPHVGMGVTKAMQDAIALTDAIAQFGATISALQHYEATRLPAGQRIVARGRRLGAYMQASASATSAPAREAMSVMQETAIDLDALAPPTGTPHSQSDSQTYSQTHDQMHSQTHRQPSTAPATDPVMRHDRQSAKTALAA
jgi:2-polyprenyl-6-methoxyphenol hydroxylase-like FAD-dependent oxidoreductase